MKKVYQQVLSMVILQTDYINLMQIFLVHQLLQLEMLRLEILNTEIEMVMVKSHQMIELLLVTQLQISLTDLVQVQITKDSSLMQISTEYTETKFSEIGVMVIHLHHLTIVKKDQTDGPVQEHLIGSQEVTPHLLITEKTLLI